jgi:hypothetical protein
VGLPAPSLNAYLFHAEVIAAYPDARLVDIKWLNMGVNKRSVYVVQDSGVYSFPKVGEVGLVIGSDESKYYYLGKIEVGYQRRRDGEELNPDTGGKWALRLIKAGEVYLSNVSKGVGLLMSNAGNFSLLTQIQDGIKYVADAAGEPLRWLTVAAKAVTVTSDTSYINVGAVIRAIPVLGNKIVRDLSKTKAAQEILAKVTNIVGFFPLDKALLHLGDIFVEPITNGMAAIPKPHTEIGAIGLATALRAILVAFNDFGIEAASVKLDNMGNVSINANLTGKAFVIGALGTHLGGTLEATQTHPAVVGDAVFNWLSTHKHDSSMGPTSVPTADSLATLATILSKKVFVSP